jgi:hypothetical protein
MSPTAMVKYYEYKIVADKYDKLIHIMFLRNSLK